MIANTKVRRHRTVRLGAGNECCFFFFDGSKVLEMFRHLGHLCLLAGM